MPQRLTSTPTQDGYRMPAEWEPHAQTWMLFPHRSDTWRWGAKPAQHAFAEVATAIAKFEPVTVATCYGQYDHARALLPSHIRVVEMTSNDAWVRDSGATFVVNDVGDVRGVDWVFNAWGGVDKGMYPDWSADDRIARKMCEIEGMDSYRAPFVLEGGAIHVDGEGTALVVTNNVLHPNRNSEMPQNTMANYLRDYLNIQDVIWLDEGVFNDETDGHIDNLACWVRPGEVALTWTDDEDDPQYEISRRAYDALTHTPDAKGRTLTVHKIPQPTPQFMSEEEEVGLDLSEDSLERRAGRRLAASYINFYIANGGVIVPQFGVPEDEQALHLLGGLFPQHDVVGIYSREILLGGGNIHCITQQQPRGRD
jgi:agmatine deiminase